MADEKFKVGDVVRLKSGGPAMTVAAAEKDQNGKLACIWFMDNQAEKTMDGRFPPETLERTEKTITS